MTTTVACELPHLIIHGLAFCARQTILKSNKPTFVIVIVVKELFVFRALRTALDNQPINYDPSLHYD
jgi:hypothetical protein